MRGLQLTRVALVHHRALLRFRILLEIRQRKLFFIFEIPEDTS